MRIIALAFYIFTSLVAHWAGHLLEDCFIGSKWLIENKSHPLCGQFSAKAYNRHLFFELCNEHEQPLIERHMWC